jgi:hypothetical protein
MGQFDISLYPRSRLPIIHTTNKRSLNASAAICSPIIVRYLLTDAKWKRTAARPNRADLFLSKNSRTKDDRVDLRNEYELRFLAVRCPLSACQRPQDSRCRKKAVRSPLDKRLNVASNAQRRSSEIGFDVCRTGLSMTKARCFGKVSVCSVVKRQLSDTITNDDVVDVFVVMTTSRGDNSW